ncbi:nuclear nucleic acid-binding protein C1D [Favolaschia claudopus]|uniref:Exosome complex protein n=1 Tax=Favolaschia claudopus TaxID=2862362 RepID=A0AAW0EHE0_9AGAR
MTTETTKLKSKLDSLNASLDVLESTLSPLFEQTLPETTVALAPIEQAKLQTLLPYIVYDLVFIYLKSKGIDPKTHPVVGELARVRKYFDKISSAENPETQRTTIDKGAATRFIKHAITQSKISEAAPDATAEAEPSTFVPVKVTTRMKERSEYEAELRMRGDASSSEDEIEVIDAPPDGAPSSSSAKGKGKAKEVVEEPVAAGTKRRRPVVDPFAGYGDEPAPGQTAEPAEVKTPKKAKKKASKSAEATPQPSTEETDQADKKRRKKEKKKAKEATEGEDTPPPKKKAKK